MGELKKLPPMTKEKEKELKSMKKVMKLKRALFARSSHSLINSLTTPEQLCEFAIEKFKLANYYKPKNAELLTSWALALGSIARERRANVSLTYYIPNLKGVKKGLTRILKEAERTFAEALEAEYVILVTNSLFSPRYLEAMENWFLLANDFKEFEKDSSIKKLREMLKSSIQNLKQTPIVIEVGNLHQRIPSTRLPHEWTAYLRSQQPLPVQLVEFVLHPTFTPMTVRFTAPPYQFLRVSRFK